MSRATRRRGSGEEVHENHERWLVSYADFITLLFAFFVVMYALSSINEGKYRVMSNSISQAFGSVPVAAAPTPITPNLNVIQFPDRSCRDFKTIDQPKRNSLKKLASELNRALAPLVQEGRIKVSEGEFGITVDINASLLFAPGDARLDLGAVRTLAAMGDILKTTEFPITVEGHTDNTPIGTPQFPSNWELSGMRASSVVRLFIETGVNPRSLTAIGYGEYRPVADNATVEGKQRNRRVAVLIESRVADNPVDVTIPTQ
ncbi:MAG TPA: flagellar motor protein MotD [Rhodocyclaceae bacterium]|nr:flagellar motor protein MotD [Rhodocyclaceae bacterium]